jgi:hypothetical protein
MSEGTASNLRAAGLVAPIFVLDIIEQDVRARLELDASLDSLIGSGDVLEVAEFNPADPA